MIDYSVGSDVQRDIFTGSIMFGNIEIAELTASPPPKKILISFANNIADLNIDCDEFISALIKVNARLKEFEDIGE